MMSVLFVGGKMLRSGSDKSSLWWRVSQNTSWNEGEAETRRWSKERGGREGETGWNIVCESCDVKVLPVWNELDVLLVTTYIGEERECVPCFSYILKHLFSHLPALPCRRNWQLNSCCRRARGGRNASGGRRKRKRRREGGGLGLEAGPSSLQWFVS